MTIKSIDEKPTRVEVDLTGPEGNAFVLIGFAKTWFKQLGDEHMMLLHGVTWPELQADLMSGDYEHLLEVLEKLFGDHVIFYR